MIRALLDSFNTTLVQLKAQFLVGCGAPHQAFQYHTGPIKRRSGREREETIPKSFQYHTGPIKSIFPPFSLSLAHFAFQYHTGPIKRRGGRGVRGIGGLFQYHTGPIKRDTVSDGHTTLCGFNTTLVQLKAGRTGANTVSYQALFQYHTGPIKRHWGWLGVLAHSSFNTTLVQ